MKDITVCVLVPNVCDRLPRCLESAAWAEDLFCVVDTKTTDGSLEIAKQYTDHVVIHEYINSANQRNWVLPQIKTDWTLVLDADEWVSEELSQKIQSIVQAPDSFDGYYVRRQSYFFGKLIKHCGWHHDYNLRLFKTQKGRYLEKRVHSKIVVNGSVGRIHETMYHDTYRTFEEFFSTFQRFTTWGAEDLFEAGKRSRLSDLIVRPIMRFFKMYILRQGFRDGFHGAVLCGLAACSVFTKYAKLWNMERLSKKDPDAFTLSRK